MNIQAQSSAAGNTLGCTYARSRGNLKNFTYLGIRRAQRGVDGAVVAAVIGQREIGIDAGRASGRGKIIGADRIGR